MRTILSALAAGAALCAQAHAGASPELDAMIARHAAANGVPASLVHRVVRAESNYNPSASHAGNHGLMQIKQATAKGLGYRGSAAGLLNPETNLRYAVAYLAGAYRAAHGNASRAVAYYRSGYYRRGRAPAVVPGQPGDMQVASAAAAIAAAPTAPAEGNFLDRLFGGSR